MKPTKQPGGTLPTTKAIVTDVTPELIEAWKQQHGEIFCLVVGTEPDVKKCYVRKPDRKTLSYASTAGASDPMQFNEIVLKNCMLGGDETILTNDQDFLAAASVLGELVAFKEAKLVKL